MKDLIAQLRQIEGIKFNPPCTPEQLDDLTSKLRLEILGNDLSALYLDHDGIGTNLSEESTSLAMRLMSHHEVIHLYRHTHDMVHPDLRLLWFDDYSTYAGLFVSGELAGNLALFDFHTRYGAPHFQSIHTFYAALIQTGRMIEPGWWNLPRDYPLR